MKFEDLKRYPDLEAAIYDYRHTPARFELSPALRDLEAIIAERETEARKLPLHSLVKYFAAQKEMFEKNPQVSAVYGEAGELVRAFQSREPIQERIARWVTETLSEESAEAGMSPLENKEERCLRFVEEAIELAQAVGIEREQLHGLVDYVMDRPVGDVTQEVGGSMLTLYAVSAACGVDADAQALKEVARVETPEIRAKVRRRQKEKREALVTNDVPRRERDQLYWVSQADFEELQKRADELEKEKERGWHAYDDLKHERDRLWESAHQQLTAAGVACTPLGPLSARVATLVAQRDNLQEENERLRQGLDCGLDCEEHAVIELTLAECAPTEEERDKYTEMAPADLPKMVSNWRRAAQQLSADNDQLEAMTAHGVLVARWELQRLLGRLERQEAQVQKLQQRGTELVNEARDARNERDALKIRAAGLERLNAVDIISKKITQEFDGLFNRPQAPCAMGKYCSRHEFTHGAEAEELREKLAQLCDRWEKVPAQRILDMLENVDARDSVAYLEFKDDDDEEDHDAV